MSEYQVLSHEQGSCCSNNPALNLKQWQRKELFSGGSTSCGRGSRALPTCNLCAQLMTMSHLLPGMENPMPERPREKEEPVVREASEAVDCHLGDMLQQLHSVNASKPSERGLVRQGGHCGPGRLGWAGKSAPECQWLVQAPGSVIPLLPPFPVHYSANKLAYWPRPSMVRPLPSFSDSSVLSPQAPHLPAPPCAACIHWHTVSSAQGIPL